MQESCRQQGRNTMTDIGEIYSLGWESSVRKNMGRLEEDERRREAAADRNL